jgi:hypothetical protein
MPSSYVIRDITIEIGGTRIGALVVVCPSYKYNSWLPHVWLLMNRSRAAITSSLTRRARLTDPKVQTAPYINAFLHLCFFTSCARACTVANEVFTEAQFFADCKLNSVPSVGFGPQQSLEDYSSILLEPPFLLVKLYI